MDETTLTVSQLRDRLAERVDAAHYRGDVTLITKRGAARAVLVPVELYHRAADGRPNSVTED